VAKFKGVHTTSVDDKGRTSIPAKLREVFGACFGDEQIIITKAAPVVTRTGEICRGLAIYPAQEFQELEDRLDRQSGFTAAELKSIRNLIIAPAEACTFDKQGRVLIPPALRSYAGLDRDIVFVGGQNNKVELWNLATWELVSGQAEQDFPIDSPLLAELGI
jgi:MraZ protein